MKKDRIGMKFGKLTIIGFHGVVGNIKSRSYYWKVKCDCGIEKLVTFGSLKSGNTKSCGCYRKEWQRKELIFTKKDDYYIVKCYGGEFLIDLYDCDKIKSIKTNLRVNNKRYAVYNIKQKNLLIHRLLMDIGEFDGIHVVDHINRDTLDNRKTNLRIVTKIENGQNRNIQSNNTSGVVGVCWDKKGEKWVARITANKKRINLGYYTNKDDAITARKNAEQKYFII